MKSNHSGESIGILWAQYGPYHFTRAAALQKLAAPAKVHALELANQTSDYRWNRSTEGVKLITLCAGAITEKLSFWKVFWRARKTFEELKLEVCFLPSYAPKQSLAALFAAKSLGIRIVMMNDSHAGTARAGWLGMGIKRRLVGMFDAALVAGVPQKRYFVSLGLQQEKIFTGYDAVDNDYFAARADEIRSRKSEVKNQYDLPEHYFLSVGRFVVKKNLTTLLQAYRKFLDSNQSCQMHLVMIGSGEEGPKLHSLCQELRLPTYDKTSAGTEDRKSKIKDEPPGVHFYGFRQIEENPVFYALADAFILPSLWEEWGLVVNEAMASGLPVIVSETAGCAEDLLEPSGPMESLPLQTLTQLAQMGLLAKARINGFVVNPKSSDELGRAMLILDGSLGLRCVMGHASRRIVEKFSCGNFARNALRAAQAAQATTR